MNFFAILALGAQVMSELAAALTTFEAGQPVALPQIKTYVGGKHLALDIKVTPL